MKWLTSQRLGSPDWHIHGRLGNEHRSYPEEEASVSMASRQHLPRGRRRRVAALSGVAAMVMLGGLSLADPAAAVGPYATSTASPPSSDAPPMTYSPTPPLPSPVPVVPDGPGPLLESPYTYYGSSTYRASGYYYTY